MTQRGERAGGRRVAFLDRDGTIIVDKGYVHRPEDLAFLPNSVAGLRALADAGFELVIVTNQSGIGRGRYTAEQAERFHALLIDKLAAEGIRIQKIYYCPHTPEAGCDCRKPRTGLVDEHLRGTAIERAACVVIGDKGSDIELGGNAGIPAILVLTGEGTAEKGHGRGARAVAADLLEAARAIARTSESRTERGA